MVTSPHFQPSKIYIACTEKRLLIPGRRKKICRDLPVKFMKMTSSHGEWEVCSGVGGGEGSCGQRYGGCGGEV